MDVGIFLFHLFDLDLKSFDVIFLEGDELLDDPLFFCGCVVGEGCLGGLIVMRNFLEYFGMRS